MGLTDLFSDLYAATFSLPEASAESPPEDHKDDQPNDGEKDEGDDDNGTDDDDEEGCEGGGEEADEEDEEEEEEEEPEDPKPKLEEECVHSKQCTPAKHHFDECVERVTEHADSEAKHKEDCVEEFFHLAHCASQCAAPKLFSQLK